jgi:hypothetical protein
LERCDGVDVYHLAAYHKAFEAECAGAAVALVVESGDNVLFHPTLLCPIGGVSRTECEWSDAQSVHGYSGPVCAGSDGRFGEQAWKAVCRWFRENGVIAEFVRFNPLSRNEEFVGAPYNVDLNRETVVLRLDQSSENLWSEYSPRHRNMVRAAARRGLIGEEVGVGRGLDTFVSLYRKTMSRRRASAEYFYSDRHFRLLADGLGHSLRLFVVRRESGIVAAALILAWRDRLHYHLSGSDLSCTAGGANNLLLHTVAEWGRERGYRWLHLGGGKTKDAGDSLLRFKAGVSRRRLPFYIGTTVHCRVAYERLCSACETESGEASGSGYFLRYRQLARPMPWT